MNKEMEDNVIKIHQKIIDSMLKVEKLLAEEVEAAGLNEQQNFLFVSRVINSVFQRHYNMCMEATNKFIEDQENDNKN